MIIVGTHLDKVCEKEDDVLKVIMTMYSDERSYPKIADVCCISNVDSVLNGAQILKDKLYNVATHLHVTRDNKC